MDASAVTGPEAVKVHAVAGCCGTGAATLPLSAGPPRVMGQDVAGAAVISGFVSGAAARLPQPANPRQQTVSSKPAPDRETTRRPPRDRRTGGRIERATVPALTSRAASQPDRVWVSRGSMQAKRTPVE